MRDVIHTALSVLTLCGVSIAIGFLPFIGHHQVFVGQEKPVVVARQ